MPVQWDFSNQVALVTGGSRGIGFAIAEILARSGAKVVITGRRQDALDAAVAEIGPNAVGVAGSVADDGHAEDAVRATIDRFGSLDILVNNAATNPQYGPLQEAAMPAVDKVWQVVLRAPLVWSQLAWREWMGENGGTILNIQSAGSFVPTPMLGAYTIGKAGLMQMTRQLALEMAPNVRVNSIAPALVKTRFSAALYEGKNDPSDVFPLKRTGTLDDCAHAAAYLLSDVAGWVTGHTLLLDGGQLLTVGH